MSAKGMPFEGKVKITLEFGAVREYWSSSSHLGIDMVGLENTNIYAVDNGEVVRAKDSGSSGYGKHIYIAHPDGTGTLYAHLKSMNVSTGDSVLRGQQIGVMGATGNVTGAHLHFEAHNSKTYAYAKDIIDPAVYLNLPVNTAGSTFEAEQTSNYNAANTAASSQSSTGSTSSQSSAGGSMDTLNTGYIDALIGTGTSYGITGEFRKGSLLYGRKYRVLVKTSKTTALDVSHLHCRFEIVKNSFMTPNTSKVQIYNLSADTENAIIQNGQAFIVEAGYQGGNRYGIIFNGEIVQPLRYKENGTDYVLQLVGMDGMNYATYSVVGVSMIAGQTQRDVIEKCASAATIPAPINQLSPDLSTEKLPRGKVLFGLARDYLSKIAKAENAFFTMNDGAIEVVKATDEPNKEIIYLDSSSGMIGNPTQTQYGVKVKMLLNPLIKINSLIAIDNRTVKGSEWRYGNVIRALDSEGIYKVIKITHIGDTRANDWYTEVETVAQAGLGALPGIMANNTTSIY